MNQRAGGPVVEEFKVEGFFLRDDTEIRRGDDITPHEAYSLFREDHGRIEVFHGPKDRAVNEASKVAINLTGGAAKKLNKYLIYTENYVGAIIYVDSATSSDTYGETQERFAKEHHPKSEYASMIRLREDQRFGDIYYDWGLASADGAWYKLIQTPDITSEQIEDAKRHLYETQDVVKMTVLKLNKMVEFTP